MKKSNPPEIVNAEPEKKFYAEEISAVMERWKRLATV